MDLIEELTKTKVYLVVIFHHSVRKVIRDKLHFSSTFALIGWLTKIQRKISLKHFLQDWKSSVNAPDPTWVYAVDFLERKSLELTDLFVYRVKFSTKKRIRWLFLRSGSLFDVSPTRTDSEIFGFDLFFDRRVKNWVKSKIKWTIWKFFIWKSSGNARKSFVCLRNDANDLSSWKFSIFTVLVWKCCSSKKNLWWRLNFLSCWSTNSQRNGQKNKRK